jgi:glucose-6-phosphate 1-dehydrogenase
MQANFVRSDELEQSWRIFDPLLSELEQSKITPSPYVFGSRGPVLADEVSEKLGVKYDENYSASWATRSTGTSVSMNSK